MNIACDRQQQQYMYFDPVCVMYLELFCVSGNGDILSYEDANLHKEASGVSGVMLARYVIMCMWTVLDSQLVTQSSGLVDVTD